MAKGDLVVGTSASNTAITFTPASGVEVTIKAASVTPTISSLRYTDANGGNIGLGVSANGFIMSGNVPCKSTLAIYIDSPGGGLTSSYGGVQTK